MPMTWSLLQARGRRSAERFPDSKGGEFVIISCGCGHAPPAMPCSPAAARSHPCVICGPQPCQPSFTNCRCR